MAPPVKAAGRNTIKILDQQLIDTTSNDYSTAIILQ